MRPTRTQYGISLIEILVVMVLLLIGILSVIRLFPGGFLVNRWSEESTFASRLAKQEVDRIANSPGNLMTAIVPVRPKGIGASPGYAVGIDTGVPPGALTSAASILAAA